MEEHEKNLELISHENLLAIQSQLGRAFKYMSNARAEELLRDKKNLWKLVKRISRDIEIPLVNGMVFAQIPILIRFFKEVLDLDRPEIAELNFPEHDTFRTFMPIGIATNHDEIIQAYVAKWKINIWSYKKPIASNIDYSAFSFVQRRPWGVYVIAHAGGDEFDQNHSGKSYDDAVKEKFSFANSIEYLLMTGYHRFTKGYFMDTKGCTRTSDLWSSGRSVVSLYRGDLDLFLQDSDRDSRHLEDGIRELVFA